MNIAPCERSERVFSPAGQKDLLSPRAKFFADPVQPDRGYRIGFNVGHVPGMGVDAAFDFNRFAFKALPLVDPDGVWLTAHLAKPDSLFEQAWSVYNEAFPDFERRSFLDQQQVMSHPRYRFSAIMDEEAVVGAIGYWDLTGFRFIEHFAVASAQRSHGYGQRVIQLMQRSLSLPILLDVDPFSTDQAAARRVAFYERLGFNYCANAVTLPPYVGKTTAPTNLMSWPMALDGAGRAMAQSAIEREVYGLHAFVPRHHAV